MRRVVILILVVVIAGFGIVTYDAFKEQRTALGPESAGTPAARVRTADDADYIRSVTKQDFAEGTVYHVRPTRSGRLAIGGALDDAWREAVSLGAPDRDALRQQFMCHPLSVVARAKSTWDLESWRPRVGMLRTMLNGCNP